MKAMKGRYLQRTEGNMWYHLITCMAVLSFVPITYVVVSLWSPEAAPTLAGLALIPLGLFYLWFIGWLMRGRWFIRYDEKGLTYRALVMTSHYPWEKVSLVRSAKSPGFLAKYHDTLVIETGEKTISFFLPDFGLNSKKPSVAFIEDMVGTWMNANPEAAARTVVRGAAPSETDEEDIYDEEQ